MSSEFEKIWAKGANTSEREEDVTLKTSSIDDDGFEDELAVARELARENERRRQSYYGDDDGEGGSSGSEREEARTVTSNTP